MLKEQLASWLLWQHTDIRTSSSVTSDLLSTSYHGILIQPQGHIDPSFWISKEGLRAMSSVRHGSLVLTSSCPCNPSPASPAFSCLGLPPCLDQRCFSAFQSPPLAQLPRQLQLFKAARASPKMKESSGNTDILPRIVNRIDVLVKNKETVE